MTDPFSYERRGRSIVTAILLAVIYAILAIGMIFLSLSQWLVGIVFVFSLPALWDLISDVRSGMSITAQDVSWYHGKNSTTIPLADIKQFRIDLRMDRSVKLTIELENGRKIRVAQPATPPLAELETTLPKAGIPFRKNPFSLL